MRSTSHFIGIFDGNFVKNEDITEVKKKPFYIGYLMVKRPKGESVDKIPFAVDYKTMESLKNTSNILDISGRMESVPADTSGKLPRFTYMLAEDYMCELPFDHAGDINEVELEGKVTYVGEVNELPGAGIASRSISVYVGAGTIPCVLWRTIAKTDIRVGDYLKCKGFMKSRTLKKSNREIVEMSVKADGFELTRKGKRVNE